MFCAAAIAEISSNILFGHGLPQHQLCTNDIADQTAAPQIDFKHPPINHPLLPSLTGNNNNSSDRPRQINIPPEIHLTIWSLHTLRSAPNTQTDIID
jgi:hypothetical protein